MTRYHLALIGAILCFVATFIVVPIFDIMGLPHPGYGAPTTAGIILLWIWARGIRRRRA